MSRYTMTCGVNYISNANPERQLKKGDRVTVEVYENFMEIIDKNGIKPKYRWLLSQRDFRRLFVIPYKTQNP